MKILFTADQHINLRKKGVPKDWAYNRFTSYFAKLAEIEHDVLILGGDFFDKAPSIQEVGLFITFVINHPKPIYIIAGNHEATTKYESFLGELDSFPNVTFCLDGGETLDLDGTTVNFMTYVGIKRGDSPPKVGPGKSILVSHARGKLAFVDPEYDFSRFSEYDLVLLGDLHSMHSERGHPKVWYPGSPYSITFEQGNSDREWGVFVVDTCSDLVPKFIPLDLPQLIKITCTPEEVDTILADTKRERDCYLVEVVGSSAELVGVNKEVKRKVKVLSEATVNLVGKTPEEEIREVLLYMKTDIEGPMELYHATT